MAIKATFIQNGNIIDYPATTEVGYGEVVTLGNTIGVAAERIKAGETGGVRLTGVFEMPTAAEAISIGDKLYYDAVNTCVTKTAGSLTCIAGIAVSAKATTTAGKVLCRIG